MQQCGVAPDTITYNAAIGACSKSLKWGLALQLLEAMPNRVTDTAEAAQAGYPAAGRDAPRGGAAADVISFTTAMQGCTRGGRWQQAMAVFEEMEQREAPSRLLRRKLEYQSIRSVVMMCTQIRGVLNDVHLKQGCTRGGRWQQAMAVFEACIIRLAERKHSWVDGIRDSKRVFGAQSCSGS